MVDKSGLAAEVVERQEWLVDMWRLQQRQDGLAEDRFGLIRVADREAIKIAQVRSTGPDARRLQRAVAARQAKDDAKRCLEVLLRHAEEEEAQRRKDGKRRRPDPAAGSRSQAGAPSPAPEDGGEDGVEEGRDPPFLAV